MGITITNSGQGSVVRFRNLGRGGVMTSTIIEKFLLNFYPGAAAAYSLRLLNNSYTGAAIRVRRSSDNTEQNIGFVNGQLDTATLLTFCGVGNGFVTTWYDQSGNARNLTQATTSAQPTIVTSGLIQSSKGKPVVYYDQSQHLSVNYGFPGANSFVFDVIKSTDTSFIMYYGGDPNNYGSVGTSGSVNTGINNNVTVSEYYKNSVLQTISTRSDIYNMVSNSNQNLITQKLSISGWPSFAPAGYAAFPFSHYKSELLLYNTDQTSNRAAIESNLSSYYSINTSISGNNLLDLYPYAAAAYSLRKLRTAYTGNAIKVRRSSDNTETDIGFVNNALDTATLLTFCGAGNGFVTIWYDQTGNNRHLVQATTANQPRVVNTGAIEIINGKPAVNFDTTVKNLSVAYGFPGPNNFIFDVLKTNDTKFVTYYGAGTTEIVGAADSTDSSTSINYAATVSNYYKNGTLQTSPTTRVQVYNLISTNSQILLTHKLELSGWTQFNLASYPVYEFTHYKNELIIYDIDKTSDRAAIESNINSYYTIY